MNWEFVRLNTLVDVITKGTTPTSVGYEFTDTGVNFVKIESIDFNGNFLPNKFAKINDECNKVLKRSQLRDGDILFSIAGALGRTALVTKEILPANTNQALAIIRLKDEKLISKEFLLRVLASESIINQVSIMKGGVAQQNLSLGQLKDFLIPLPPLATQQRIVEKLDSVFAEIDTARAAAEANVNNAEALFQSYLTEVFERGGEGWVDFFTGDVCSKITDGKHGDCVNEESSGFFFLSAKDIKNGKLNYLGAREITKHDFEETHRRTNLECGDVLVTNSGTIGRMAIAEENKLTRHTTFQKSVAILKPKADIINSKFLFHLLTSKLLHFNQISAGAAQKNLLLRDIRTLKIKIPDELSEQIKISNNCDLMRKKTSDLENSYKLKLIELSLYCQSILKQAFNGELVKE